MVTSSWVGADHALHCADGDQTNRSSAMWLIINVWLSLPHSSNFSSNRAKTSLSHIVGGDFPPVGRRGLQDGLRHAGGSRAPRTLGLFLPQVWRDFWLEGTKPARRL